MSVNLAVASGAAVCIIGLTPGRIFVFTLFAEAAVLGSPFYSRLVEVTVMGKVWPLAPFGSSRLVAYCGSSLGSLCFALLMILHCDCRIL